MTCNEGIDILQDDGQVLILLDGLSANVALRRPLTLQQCFDIVLELPKSPSESCLPAQLP